MLLAMSGKGVVVLLVGNMAWFFLILGVAVVLNQQAPPDPPMSGESETNAFFRNLRTDRPRYPGGFRACLWLWLTGALVVFLVSLAV